MSEPHFFSFRKPPDWKRGTSYQLEVNKSSLSIVREQTYQHVHRHFITHPQMTKPVDVTVDPTGRWFVLDDQGTIWRTDLTSGHVESLYTFNRAEEGQGNWKRIVATQEAIIALRSDTATELQSMSSDLAQIKWSVSDWDGQAMQAVTLAADPSGGVLVLSSLEANGGLQLLRYSAAGAAADLIHLPFYEDLDFSNFRADRFELTIGSPDQAWLLDKEEQHIFHINLLANTASMVPKSTEAERISTLCGAGSDSFWGLLLDGHGEMQLSLVRMQMNGTIIERGSVGIATGNRLFAAHHSIYLWDDNERCVHIMQLKSETAVWKPFGRRLGVWISDSLDSGVPETEWHKIVLHSSQDIDTRINIRYFVSETKEVVLGHERVNLDSYIVDPSIPAETKLSSLSTIWSNPLHDPEDALLLEAKGRYLWMYIELIGSERHSPNIHSLEVHFPRVSYLEYLPSIYQRHETSKDFLSRYLSLFQTMLDETDRNIQRVTRTFDANQVTGSSLKWLLGWIGIKAEDNWTEDQLRQLLKQAPVIYSLRGTKYAMEALISIFTGEKPIILEYEQVKPLKEHPELGEVAERLYAADPHVFNVLVKPEHAETEKDRVTLQQLIEASKPAFSTGKLIILQPWVYMDLHSYLGMNTVLSEPTLLTLDGRSSMPHHTITIDVGQDNRVDQHTRLGLDSRLE